ncbi:MULTISPECIES: FUSC family protein [unclassified Streptomyces]|uniref:FUSC family protein n=1 Tax=unclassified Streptomyces TaxID=2593676 RepID=UPI0011CCC77C|nr:MULTISPECIES: FUSC family protein [unclassified Streptomyces]TXS08560.1 FUSC family protein [Streptomyces sp. wa22]WSQ75734.1 FUSC family protein [Streptomyces sp. NBC_01213]WSQ82982.1 FUSC family protein [Streptomyces sp. NBC_01212]
MPTPLLPATRLPPWLAHVLRAQRGPVPWNAVLRGALAALPLLAAVLAERPTAGVPAALGAMLAGINDRPGSRRASVARLGLPALAGSAGLLCGSVIAETAGDGRSLVVLPLVFGLLGLGAGAISSTGPVASACGTQVLVAVVIGAGMPLPEPGPLRALLFLAGAGWLLLLRLVLPSPGGRRSGPYGLDGEREAVAAVYEAAAELLLAVGGPRARAGRAALSAALDQAQDALTGPRLRRFASSAAERRLHAQYAAAFPLAEAATALAWAGVALPARIVEGPRRLAAAVRTGGACGPLPAPARTDAGLRALDDALLRAATVFDRPAGMTPGTRTGHSDTSVLGRAWSAAGLEYGLRVSVCCATSTVLAQWLHHEHWYWLPATTVFLVKPDLGPLASRVVCRAVGTVAGAAVFGASSMLVSGPAPLVATVALCGALLPVATRHFAVQTAVVTVLVLSLVLLGGEPPASWGRVVESLLACGTVLLVGHLPMPGRRGHSVRAALDTAVGAAHRYLGHVLDAPEDQALRGALRRDAYRSLAQARTAIDLSAAELPPVSRHSAGSEGVAGALEQLIDTTTACAVQLDHRAAELPPAHAELLATHLSELDRARAVPVG